MSKVPVGTIQGYRTVYTESRPVESYGKCRKCNRKSILGDGLCKRCWDRAELTIGKDGIIYSALMPKGRQAISME